MKELNTGYQQAVKYNDVATIDAMLADDFMLVTGAGKSYGKAGILEALRPLRIFLALSAAQDFTAENAQNGRRGRRVRTPATA